jgi:hypothetical protein
MRSIRFQLDLPKWGVKLVDPPSDKPKYPTEQLELIHDEVDRQRSAIAARRTGMHTRSAVLVTAAGILASVQTTSWVSGWQVVSIGLFIVAAVLGLVAMRPMTGEESHPETLFSQSLGMHPYSIEHRIVKDNIGALNSELSMMKRITRTLRIGYIVLGLAWVSMVGISALTQLKVI